MTEFKSLVIKKSSLEIYLTDNDLEYIANGFDLEIPLGNEKFGSVFIKKSLKKDLVKSVINFDKKIMSQADLQAREFAKEVE
ncbi:hypothetical protein [Streptococcus agalactiae]|uniref:hypothetical protein n=1 Tax=Streptococcus agalactiae TaxID=1311 RepID=UPI0002BA663F|nr:hypothetical protein [Streptococcus agalactiae]EPU45480.1 hypothetical protein SAG0170_07475 [Streptococcus agalactiae LDS 617]